MAGMADEVFRSYACITDHERPAYLAHCAGSRVSEVAAIKNALLGFEGFVDRPLRVHAFDVGETFCFARLRDAAADFFHADLYFRLVAHLFFLLVIAYAAATSGTLGAKLLATSRSRRSAGIPLCLRPALPASAPEGPKKVKPYRKPEHEISEAAVRPERPEGHDHDAEQEEAAEDEREIALYGLA